jgi:restriction system protein
MSKGSRINSTLAPERYSAIELLVRFSSTPKICPLHFAVEWASDNRGAVLLSATGISSSPPILGTPTLVEAATAEKIGDLAAHASLTISGLIVPEGNTRQGTLVLSTSAVWAEIATRLSFNWDDAFRLSSDQWEELIAGAFKKAGYDEVTLTPRSGDHGRDVIAIKKGIGCIKILGSVKAYAPDHLVEYDHVRALLGLLSGERDASKGIITTTSDFPPKIGDDPFIAPFLPTRLELLNGKELQHWLARLSREGKE